MGVDHGNMVQNAQVPGTGKDAPGEKCEKSQMGGSKYGMLWCGTGFVSLILGECSRA